MRQYILINIFLKFVPEVRLTKILIGSSKSQKDIKPTKKIERPKHINAILHSHKLFPNPYETQYSRTVCIWAVAW